ncbi:MAG: AarF/ABC1/UbiB kinase family protein [bacterium]|nr:AarF/ABC1/UbiB kinase family protein [bacterium]
MSKMSMSKRKRFFMVARVFLMIFYDFSREFKLIKNKGYAYSQKKMAHTHKKRAQQLYDTAIALGGILIKLCQFFSSRRDIFPEPYIQLLSTLQDKVPPISFEEIEGVLKTEYGDNYKQYFKKIEKEPLASASLGQVHKAELNTGEEVVLKVLKPGIEETIDVDSAILFYVIRLLSNFRIFRERADFFDILEEFIRVTGDELNFTREMWVTVEFKKHLKKFSYIKVPYVHQDLCRSKIIVMEFLTGDKIHDMELWKKRNNDPILISRRIIELYMEQFLFIGLIHFDPHPGNMLVTDDSNIILLDFGMSGEISEKTREGIRDSLEGFIRKDYRMILDILNDLGFIRKGVNRYSFMPIMEFFFDEVLDAVKLERESYHTVDLSPIIEDFADIIYSQPIILPVEWAFIGKTIGILVGITAMLNPEIKLYDELRPYIEKLLKENAGLVASKFFKYTKSNIKIITRLPAKLDNFIDNMERGYYKIAVDYKEVIDKVDEVKVFFIKLVSFTVSSATIVSAYYFYTADRIDLAIIFFVFSFFSFIVSLFYRRRSMKDRLKKYF